MRIVYHPRYNISLGPLGALHPFDGRKFAAVMKRIGDLPGLLVESPEAETGQAEIDAFVGDLLRRLLPRKRYVLQALEVPYIPLLPMSLIDRRVLSPMRWGVAGTFLAARQALDRGLAWNLSGGYHHASRRAAEGFCLYNDIGIAVARLRREKWLAERDRLLIVDVDAHHGNGNADVFMDDRAVFIVDAYNDGIYPTTRSTRARIDLPLALAPGTDGETYLSRLGSALDQMEGGYKLAFVVAGTDVLKGDPLGGLSLSIDDCVRRDALILSRLETMSVPAVVVGGGGYSAASVDAISASIRNLVAQPR